MLSSISPLVERAPRTRWWRLAGSYLLASVAGGAGLGLALGGVGHLLRLHRAWPEIAVATAALTLLAAAADLSGRVPTGRRQVDETWLTTYRDWVIGAGFGGQLGFGAVTIVTSASTYLTWWFELATGSLVAGAVIGGCFGLARAVPLLGMAGVRDPIELRRRNAAIVTALPVARGATVAAQVLVGGSAVAAAFLVAR
jgi:sulfite exporter TauE/SafE